MFDQVYMMNQLDFLRRQQKVSVAFLTKDITTTRSYHRYMSGGVTIAFDTLLQLLNRMKITMIDFSYYMNNRMSVDFKEEGLFVDHIIGKRYKEAQALYEEKLSDQKFHTMYADKTAPIGVIKLQYVQKKITYDEAYEQIRNILALEALLEKRIITDDDVNALYVFMDLRKPSDDALIIDILKRMLIKQDYKQFLMLYEHVMLMGYLILLEVLIETKHMTADYHHDIKVVTSKALEFISRAMLSTYEIMILSMLYDYANRYQLPKDDYIFYYFSSILTITDQTQREAFMKRLKPEDKVVFMKQLSDKTYHNKTLYEGLIDEKDI